MGFPAGTRRGTIIGMVLQRFTARSRTSLVCVAVLAALAHAQPTTAPATQPAQTPAVGDKAPDFTLSTPDGTPVSLSATLEAGPAVVVMLRGYPGYQCPVCTKQVNDLIVRRADFAAENARVILVYPGPADGLKTHAEQFAGDKAWPEHFKLVIDPDYAFTNAWHLRWDKAGETAYPASFVVDRSGVIRFAKVSQSHGGRASAGELVKGVKAAR